MKRTFNPKKRVKSNEKRTFNKPKVEKLEELKAKDGKVEIPVKREKKKKY